MIVITLSPQFYQVVMINQNNLSRNMFMNINMGFTTDDTNWLMKVLNGNGVRYKILYQNIPGTINHETIQDIIETILVREDPHILTIAEPTTDAIMTRYKGYRVIPGTIRNGRKLRINTLIKEHLDVEILKWNLDIPTTVLRLGDLTVV